MSSEPVSVVSPEPIVAWKGFDANLACRGFQYEIGGTFEHNGPVGACVAGLHGCEYPLDVFAYYEPSNSRFCSVELSGEISRDSSDSKIAAAKLKVVAEVGIPQIVSSAVAWIMARIDNSSAATNTGYSSAATNTGDSSAATNTGNSSAATNTGYSSAATNTGYSSAATNTGYSSAATNTGDSSAATNTGDSSAATNTGYSSAAQVYGVGSVAIVTGYASKARAVIGSAIVLCHRNDAGELTHIFASLVGQNGIKPDTWYRLGSDGQPVEIGI